MADEISNYRKKALELLDDYLEGRIPKEILWAWAQNIIIAEKWGQLPMDLHEAIHGLWLLHDEEGDWIPGIDDLHRIKKMLSTPKGQ